MGPIFRKLVYCIGLVAGGTGVAMLGHEHDSAFTAATISAVTNLLGGVGGNLAHEVLNATDVAREAS